jgi:hypothetical protein
MLCFVDRASRYNRVKKNQLDAQLILSIFRQPLHVSGVSRPIIRRYNPKYLFFLDDCLLSWMDIHPGQQTVNNRQWTTDSQKQTVNNRQSTTDGQQQTVNNRQSTTDGEQQTVKNRQSKTDSQQQTVNNRQSTTDGQQQTVNNRQSKTDSQQQTVNNRQSATDGQQQTVNNRRWTTDSQQQTVNLNCIVRFFFFFLICCLLNISQVRTLYLNLAEKYVVCSRSGNSEKFALSVKPEGSLEVPNGLVLSCFRTTVRCPFTVLLSKKHSWPCLSPPSFDHLTHVCS